jgi:cell division protein FtsZ
MLEEGRTLNFDIPPIESSIIKVIGLGGGGCNAVNYMYRQGIRGVEFVICNTDRQALENSPVSHKIPIGNSLTGGRGVGGDPEKGKKAALENIDDIKRVIENNTKMLFITTGMGGGTGTGAAPVIAKLAREMDIVTVGIVTYPFEFEGKKRREIAEQGIKELNNYVDALITIHNEKLLEMYSDLVITQAFGYADNVLALAAKGIAEIITVTGIMNVDFEDVKSIMKNSGTAIMGSAVVEGENRAQKAIEAALSSPLLKEKNIKGAKHILLNISYGNKEVQINELTMITTYIKEQVGDEVDMKIGYCLDESLGNKLSVTIIATALEGHQIPPEIITENVVVENDPAIVPKEIPKKQTEVQPVKVIIRLDEDEPVNTEMTTEEDQNLRQPWQQMEIPFTSRRLHADEPYIAPDNQDEDEQRLKALSYSIKSPKGLEMMEDVPAFKRQRIEFNDVPHSSDNDISKFVLNEDPETKKPEIKEENAFLDPKVD